MAGEWLKMEVSLPDKPEVLRVARSLGIDKDCVVGKLVRLWRWFDRNSVDGVVDGVVAADVDEICYQPGFASALKSVGWLSIDAEAERIAVPKFDRHNGESAKKRALKSERQARWRQGKDGDEDSEVDAKPSTHATTREEKRREEEIQEGVVYSEGFSRFWEVWPKHFRKESKGRCFASWKKAKAEPLAATIVSHVERLKRSPNWIKDEGQFIPAPLAYLNGRRWEGADEAGNDDPYGLKKAVNYGG